MTEITGATDQEKPGKGVTTGSLQAPVAYFILPILPRSPRSIKAGLTYHVINRGNGRMRLLHKEGDYAAFAKVLACYRATKLGGR